MKRRIISRTILLVLLISIMVAVFVFSHQPADVSSQVSGGLIYRFLSFIVSGFDSLSESERAEMINSLQFVVRKGAHAFIYTVMGAVSMGLMATLEFRKNGMPCVLALLICILYSISDEIHQLFVAGRSGQVSDVLLDSCGAAFGIAVIAFFVFVTRKRRQRRNIA